MRNRMIKCSAFLAILALIVTSLYWSYVKAYFYKDCGRDHRWAWEVVKHTSARKIITDGEMRNYLMFRSGFEPPARIVYPKKLPERIPTRSVVILGGARRPDVYPGYADTWYGDDTDRDWLLISEAPFPRKPWRLSHLRIYQKDSTGSKAKDKKEQTPAKNKYYQYHPTIKGMRKIAELDVGNTDSEKKLNYRNRWQIWSGSRYFPYPNGEFYEDDGKAHRGEEKIILSRLKQNRPLVIVKRLDPAVAHQKIKVLFQDVMVGTWSPCQEAIPGYWHESAFTIPPEFVTATSGELTFSMQESDHDINSFYYWFFQP